ncbi:disease resistance protein RPM1-like [Lolium rigidum]|uniref:disease resistance protein RPM1-like n=1 Tax=Lolium rigidum TaxID=89674 RepID=UPI001F5D4248|nr:disease resistance protein RPM1-like [Lolium rigidum]XP_047074281.1 disease resistance protein RPM1-like [Lolium rigidum]XP_047074284.1 disease resistance protein RPM1-like [Lolium rigidum]XP_047074289.1 disease resistance protein RPM1-like [Lolium rigidum]
MAEVVILSVVIKIGVALGKEAVKQASLQFQQFNTQLTELQGRMGRIRMELRLMHGFLCGVDIRNRRNQTYEIWVQELRMLAHEIEDIMDEYLYFVGHKHGTGWGTYLKKGCKQPNVLISLNKIASMVMEAETNLGHLFLVKSRWVSVVDGGNSSNSSDIVERSQHLASSSRSLGEEDLVGVDEDREQLETWLRGMHLDCSVVIVLHGMGGLGKTALAANVYMKEREKFDCHAWVFVSQTYSTKDVLKRLITELYKESEDTPGDITNLEIDGLQNILITFIADKKYLIILDDVWTPKAFDEFSRLIRNGKNSRLIITTREGDVAARATPDRMLTLKDLPEDKAWDLFCKTTFASYADHECPKDLKPLSEEIVLRCKGLPLAIVSVGSLLRVREKTVEEWRRINDQLGWELINNPMLGDVRNVLHLSYIYLPTQLKSCFLYCSLFSEGYLFGRNMLARLWTAEGFIEERGASTFEQVAEGYMKELVQRNMLQLVQRNSFGRMKMFRMHDILRELAIDLCRNDLFGVTYDEDRCAGSLDKDGRRLVVQKLKKDIERSISSVHQLRSITVLDKSMPSLTLLHLLCEMSTYMTVLELSGLPIVNIPYAIGNLFNLRHLGLRRSKVKMLPKSVEKLSNLLTLDLSRSDIDELPGGIVKLKKLRHLFAQKVKYLNGRFLLSSSGVRIRSGLGNLTNLQTLQSLEAQDESVRKLRELRQLRSLRLFNVKRVYHEPLCESLVEMHFLSKLHVIASDENEVLLLNALPPNLQKLNLTGKLDIDSFQAVGRNLYSLRLNLSQLTEDPLPSISLLSNLTELFLDGAYNGEKLVFLAEWFPNLKTLQLRDLHNLKKLDIQEGAMVTLEKLSLVNLDSITEIPPGIKFLVTLRYLGFHEITQGFLTLLRECVRNGGMRQFWYTPRA